MAEFPLLLAGFYARSIRRVRVVSGWERALHGPAGKEVLRMVLRHTAVQEHMLMASLELIGEQAAYHRKTLLVLGAQARDLERRGRLFAAHADEIVKDLEATERQLAALERRAASGSPESRALVPEAVRAAAVEKLEMIRPVTRSDISGLIRRVGGEVDPALHAGLTRAFEAGPLGHDAWALLGEVIQNSEPHLVHKNVMQHLGEMLAASHPAYRATVGETSRLIEAMGLTPVEVIGDSWLLSAGGTVKPEAFRDGLLLAVTEPAVPLQRIGEAGLAVSLESKQAKALYEATFAAEAQAALQPSNYQPAQSAVLQQVGAGRRTDTAIDEGALLLTGDGSLYRLRPVPSGLTTNVLARPLLLPEEYLKTLASVPVTSIGHPADVAQILTPYGSEQLNRYAGGLIARLRRLLE
jgi:hypothetical protein